MLFQNTRIKTSLSYFRKMPILLTVTSFFPSLLKKNQKNYKLEHKYRKDTIYQDFKSGKRRGG